MSGDSFTRDKLAWVQQVAVDAKLPPSAVRVAVLLATEYMNRDTGDAWPAIGTLAGALGLTARGVQKAIKALEEAAHMSVEPGGGRDRSNRYRWKLWEEKPRTDVQGFDDAETPNGRSERVNTRSRKPRTGVHPNPMKEPYEEPFEVSPYSPPNDLFAEDRRAADEPPASDEQAGPATDEGRDPSSGDGDRGDAGAPPPDAAGADANGFEAFWQHYPRRVAKGAARKAWSKAIREADPGEIIRGAMRYAAERDGQDPRFTKHPATWLRGECWADDPAPAANVVPFTGGRRGAPSGMDAAAALIAAHAEAEAEASGGWGL